MPLYNMPFLLVRIPTTGSDFARLNGNIFHEIVITSQLTLQYKSVLLDLKLSFEILGSTMFQYYIKIVPTSYARKDGTIISSNQFSVTKHQKVVSLMSGESGMPGIFFQYELSPLMVKYSEKERSFGHFITNLCAIIGGVYTVAGLLDSFLYHSIRLIQKKMELGKLH